MSSPHIGHIPKDFRLDNFLMVLTSDTIMKRFFKKFFWGKNFLKNSSQVRGSYGIKMLYLDKFATHSSLLGHSKGEK